MNKKVAIILFCSILSFVILACSCGSTITPTITNRLANTASSKPNDKQVAESVVVNFFSVDYSKSTQWLDQLSSITISTEMKLMKDTIYPAIWPIIKTNKLISLASITDSALEVSGTPNNLFTSNWELWVVSGKVDVDWPDMPAALSSFTGIIWPTNKVINENIILYADGGLWKLGMFVSESDKDFIIKNNSK